MKFSIRLNGKFYLSDIDVCCGHDGAVMCVFLETIGIKYDMDRSMYLYNRILDLQGAGQSIYMSDYGDTALKTITMKMETRTFNPRNTGL